MSVYVDVFSPGLDLIEAAFGMLVQVPWWAKLSSGRRTLFHPSDVFWAFSFSRMIVILDRVSENQWDLLGVERGQRTRSEYSNHPPPAITMQHGQSGTCTHIDRSSSLVYVLRNKTNPAICVWWNGHVDIVKRFWMQSCCRGGGRQWLIFAEE